MDAVVKSLLERPQPQPRNFARCRPTREEAEAAVRVLLRWTGDDPAREGLRDTPNRVVKAYEEFFSGYEEDATDVLARVFEEVQGYDDIVLVRDIPFSSHCEHHMVPFFGIAHIAYYPSEDWRRRAFETRPTRRRLRQAPADAGVPDRADCRCDRSASASARLRRHARSGASVHVDAWRAQTRRGDHHDPIHRRLPRSIRRSKSASSQCCGINNNPESSWERFVSGYSVSRGALRRGSNKFRRARIARARQSNDWHWNDRRAFGVPAPVEGRRRA